MEDYRRNTFRSYIDKEPQKYSVPTSIQTRKEIKEVGILKPQVNSVEFHKYPNEHALVLEGDNLWFCHKIRLGERNNICDINTPAQNITRRSIQFNFTSSRGIEGIVSSNGQVKVTLYSHFASPIRKTIKVEQVRFYHR